MRTFLKASHRQTRVITRPAAKCIQREAQHFSEGVFGFAGEAGSALVEDRLLPESQPSDHSSNEPVAFGHVEQSIDHRPMPEAAGMISRARCGPPAYDWQQ